MNNSDNVRYMQFLVTTIFHSMIFCRELSLTAEEKGYMVNRCSWFLRETAAKYNVSIT